MFKMNLYWTNHVSHWTSFWMDAIILC